MNLKILDYMEKYGFEQLVLCHDKASGLKGLIAIHDTTLGPALGGTRMWPYSSEDEALLDVLRLSRAMSYKAAAAGLNLGGGKAVIVGDPRKDKSEALFRAFGRYVQSLNGRYITAEDVGTAVEDMDYIRMETKWVTGGSSTSGDPSPATAYGVWKGMRAAARELWGKDSLTNRTVVVQGLGHVGYHLCRHLYEEGSRLMVTDILPEAVKRVIDEFKAIAIDPKDIYEVDGDIFAPCALGAVINDETLPLLKFKIIAGAANNVLKEDKHGDLLEQKGILYVPDYVINAGGLINVSDELYGYNRERAFQRITGIYDNVRKVLDIAKRDRIPTYRAADIMAEERIQKIGRVRRNWL